MRRPDDAAGVWRGEWSQNGADLLVEQGRLISKAMGMSEAKIAETSALRAQVIAIVRAEKDPAAKAQGLARRGSMAPDVDIQDRPTATAALEICDQNPGRIARRAEMTAGPLASGSGIHSA